MTGDLQVFIIILLVGVKNDHFGPYSVYSKAIERINSAVPTMMFEKVLSYKGG